uniref:response regulator transcription factor n=1 Tax=Thaumasiovibrio occultus TaxID=1891184 RepID=UPI000B3591EC|nr:response regulator transcription factor [Thaumasiovibrio occultus]
MASSIPTIDILLVEDDRDLAELLKLQLAFQGHQISHVTGLAEASARLQQQSFQLLVLDRSLTDGDGVELCRQLREQHFTLSILMLTAKGSELDKVAGLEAGADDYMTKPFSVMEFQARVRALLRRQQRQEPIAQSLHFPGLVINPERHEVNLDDRPVQLTANEFSLLHALAQTPGTVMSKDDLLASVWHTHCQGYHHTVCSTVNRLRNKLSTERYCYVHTVWGVGYKFDPRPLERACQ